MRTWVLRLALWATAGSLASLATAFAHDGASCTKASGDAQIAACTRIITAGGPRARNLAAAHTNRANAYFRKGDADHALADYNEAIRLDPKLADAYNGRGNVYHDLKRDLDRALADYDEAIRLNPKLAYAYNGRGNVYDDKGDRDRAFSDYTESIRLDPKIAEPHNGLGNVYMAKRDLDHAFADYDEAIRLDPAYAIAYQNRSHAHLAKGEVDQAVADLDEAVRVNPNDANNYARRGGAYLAKGDLDHVIADEDEAIRRDPKLEAAYFILGIAALYGGDLAKAQADLSQANALDPKDAYAAIWFDIAGRRNGQPSALSQTSAQVDMTKWPAPVIRMFLGQLPRDAVLAAADAPEPFTKQGQVCEANMYGGEGELRSGAKDDATRLYKEAANDCPKDFTEWATANLALKALGAAP